MPTLYFTQMEKDPRVDKDSISIMITLKIEKCKKR
jgi:hypothetical protein